MPGFSHSSAWQRPRPGRAVGDWGESSDRTLTAFPPGSFAGPHRWGLRAQPCRGKRSQVEAAWLRLDPGRLTGARRLWKLAPLQERHLGSRRGSWTEWLGRERAGVGCPWRVGWLPLGCCCWWPGLGGAARRQPVRSGAGQGNASGGESTPGRPGPHQQLQQRPPPAENQPAPLGHPIPVRFRPNHSVQLPRLPPRCRSCNGASFHRRLAPVKRPGSSRSHAAST